MTVNDAIQMWLKLGVSSELGYKVKEKTKFLLNDKSVMKKIEKSYSKMLNSYIINKHNYGT